MDVFVGVTKRSSRMHGRIGNVLHAGHHGCGKLYWGSTIDDNGCRTADTYNHYYTRFHSPSEHTIDEVQLYPRAVARRTLYLDTLITRTHRCFSFL